MTLKAVYFELMGFSANQPVRLHDLHAAKKKAEKLHVTWIGNLHNLVSWSQILVSTGGSTPGLSSASMGANMGLGNTVISKTSQLSRIWNETLRYHKNRAYVHETDKARTIAERFLLNSRVL